MIPILLAFRSVHSNQVTDCLCFPGIGRKLEENLGKIEKVKGYIVIRECSSVTSLNFLKSLKEIEPQERFFTKELILYNDRFVKSDNHLVCLK